MSSPDWMNRAACRGKGPHPWFGPEVELPAVRDRRVAEAKRICRACPVRPDCLSWALSRPAQVGVAGGLTAAERDAERRRRMRRAS